MLQYLEKLQQEDMEDLIKKRDFQRALMVDVAKANEVSICKWRYYANRRMQPYFWLLLLSAEEFFFSVETSDSRKYVWVYRLTLYVRACQINIYDNTYLFV